MATTVRTNQVFAARWPGWVSGSPIPGSGVHLRVARVGVAVVPTLLFGVLVKGSGELYVVAVGVRHGDAKEKRVACLVAVTRLICLRTMLESLLDIQFFDSGANSTGSPVVSERDVF